MTARSGERHASSAAHHESAAPEEAFDRGATAGPPEGDALLVALTLSPATYSRNRFFEMYRAPEVMRARRRSVQLRSVIGALASDTPVAKAGRLISIEPGADGGALLKYDVPAVGMRRTVRLHALEVSLLRYCVGRGRGERTPPELAAEQADLDRIAEALRKLSPILPPAAPSNEV